LILNHQRNIFANIYFWQLASLAVHLYFRGAIGGLLYISAGMLANSAFFAE